MSNQNCLVNMACPACGSDGPYEIVATCKAIVSDDGVDESTEFEWNDDSPCKCRQCGHQGKVLNFCLETE